MKHSRLLTQSLVAAACCGAMGSACAVPVVWTDWNSIGAFSASGTMGGVTVSVSSVAPMNGVSQTGTGTNYWTEPNALDRPYTGGTIDNAPTAAEQVGLYSANSITVTFSAPVTSLYMALLSIGQPAYTVTYDFGQAFTIDSEGQGYWGNDLTNGVIGPGDTLAMREFHGVLHFNAPQSGVSFTTNPAEYWHAFTFGMVSVPEPASLALLGLGLLGLGFSRRSRA